MYKELLASSNLDDLYKSAIAANASYTMINASYEDNTNNYLNDILIYLFGRERAKLYATVGKEGWKGWHWRVPLPHPQYDLQIVFFNVFLKFWVLYDRN
mgnify:CR=1 FL=1